MTGNTEVSLMAGRAAFGGGGGLGPMIVFTPSHHVVAGTHDLMALIAGVALVTREHRVAA